MKFRPLHDRVVVKRIDAEEKIAGGIIIPDTAKEKPLAGRDKPPSAPVGVTKGLKEADPDRFEGRQHRAVRQVVGHRSENRWSGSPDRRSESDIMGVISKAAPPLRKRAQALKLLKRQADIKPKEFEPWLLKRS